MKNRAILFAAFMVCFLKAQVPYSNSKPVFVDSSNVNGYYLDQYLPLPFSPVTYTEFSIPEECKVKLFVSDTLGQVIDSVYNGVLKKGRYRFDFTTVIKKYKGKQSVLFARLNMEAFSSHSGMYLQNNTVFKSTRDIFWVYN